MVGTGLRAAIPTAQLRNPNAVSQLHQYSWRKIHWYYVIWCFQNGGFGHVVFRVMGANSPVLLYFGLL